MVSARKTTETEFFDTASVSSKGDGRSEAIISKSRYVDTNTGGIFDIPSISTSAAGIASAKAAGRINAASISPEDHEAYLVERSRLLDKFFAGIITRKEELRLEYVRWTLDRIEDAMHGAALDMLESHVEIYENFLSEMQYFHDQVSHLTGKRR